MSADHEVTGTTSPAAGPPGASGAPVITVSALIVTDGHGSVLTVRKRGTSMFMLPGGKPEPGESPAETAVREFEEELGVRLDADLVEPVDELWTAAANEAGHQLRSFVFRCRVPVPEVRVAAEIEEARWVTPDALGPTDAPLTQALRDRLLGA